MIQVCSVRSRFLQLLSRRECEHTVQRRDAECSTRDSWLAQFIAPPVCAFAKNRNGTARRHRIQIQPLRAGQVGVERRRRQRSPDPLPIVDVSAQVTFCAENPCYKRLPFPLLVLALIFLFTRRLALPKHRISGAYRQVWLVPPLTTTTLRTSVT